MTALPTAEDFRLIHRGSGDAKPVAGPNFKAGHAAGRTAARNGYIRKINIGFGDGSKANTEWRQGFWAAAATELGFA